MLDEVGTMRKPSARVAVMEAALYLLRSGQGGAAEEWLSSARSAVSMGVMCAEEGLRNEITLVGLINSKAGLWCALTPDGHWHFGAASCPGR